MERRSFIKAGIKAGLAGTVGATAALAAPAVTRAQSSITWKMTNAYGPNAPFYVVGPGSPTDMAKKLDTMSGGRLKIQHFAAGELIPALEGCITAAGWSCGRRSISRSTSSPSR